MRNSAKVLHFPFAGVSRSLSVRDSTLPSENRAYATPLAMNVRGTCVFADRRRGGSRPSFTAPVITTGTIEAYYRGRRFYADGTNWYASRTSDYTDFNQGGDGDDPTRPVMGNVALPYRVGSDAITAMFAPTNDAIYIATANSLWVMRGEPTAGNFALISATVGCVSKDAWAWEGGRFFLLNEHGLYTYSQGNGTAKISEEIPFDLRGATAAALSYEEQEKLVHVVTEGCGNWTYETETKAWWPFNLSTSASFVAIGPFRTSARDDEDGMLDTIHAAMAAQSNPVTLEIYPAKTAEEALAKARTATSPAFTASVGAGFNHTIRPRVRGAWCIVRLSCSGAWGYETMTITCKQLGRLR